MAGDEQLIPGNIDLKNRPRVKNADGSISTVRSIGVNFDGKEYVIPTVSDDGRILSDDQAIKLFQRTKRHLGAFKTPEAATAFAERLHEDQAKMVEGMTGKADAPNFDADDDAPNFDADTDSKWQEAGQHVAKKLGWGATIAGGGMGGLPAGVDPRPGAAVGGIGTVALLSAPAVAAGASALGSMGAGQLAVRGYGAYNGMTRGYKTAGIPGALLGGALGAVKPVGTNIVEGAIGGFQKGGLPGAVEEGVLNAVLSGKGGAVLQYAGKLGKALGLGAEAVKAAPAVVKVAEVAMEAAPAIEKAVEVGAKVGPYVPGTEKLIDGIKFVWGAKGGWKKAAGAAEKIAEAAPAVASKVKNVIKPITDHEELIARIKELRDVNKFSPQVIAESLKQWHGIPMKEATQAVKMVLGAN